MSYEVVFTNGENRELIVDAPKIHTEKGSEIVTFLDNAGQKVAVVPLARILYIVKNGD